MSKKNIFENEKIGEIRIKLDKENICPCCNYKLQKRYEGLVCKNHRCVLYFKLERGFVYLNGKKKISMEFFKNKYDFNIENFENKKRWLIKKSEILSERGRRCEICGSEISIHIHHILYRSEYPELTFDNENLMVVCEDCHKKLHENDKWRFS